MNNQTEYYLESLITEAFKGKGFQKISDLFAEKASCSSQRHSKAMLTQLDRLINKELDRNEFRHVTLLMKCIQHFCKNDSHEAFSLIHQGLISKMVIWFERTLEFLKICDEDNTFISELVEEIYDTVVVICRSDNKEGVKQLVDSFLFTLGLVITENWPAFHIRLEAIKTFNLILDHIALEEKKSLQASEDMGALMKTMARNLFDVGDYDVQVAISEALCRMTPRKLRENLAQLWFEDDFFAQAFLQVNDKDFETDCRNFLNCLNSRGRDGQRVYTFPCIDVFADSEKLRKPQDSKLEHFWIDFNVGSQCVSFYIQNHEGLLWDSVRLQKGLVAAYSLQDVDGQTLLNLHSRNFFLINRKEAKLVRIYFESKHNVEHAVIKTYGEELKMTVIGQDGSVETSTQAISSPSTGCY
ncbi:synaptonemal complex protein 2-like [Hyperolius riggenbachi]|uniref:synaptonemal complex protein 2-like n=1 Tax=Hyperolius riggenbachi TaxID=752182 RepID=UPI0035A29677